MTAGAVWSGAAISCGAPLSSQGTFTQLAEMGNYKNMKWCVDVIPFGTKLPVGVGSPCAGPAHGAAEEAATVAREAGHGQGAAIAGGEDAVA